MKKLSLLFFQVIALFFFLIILPSLFISDRYFQKNENGTLNISLTSTHPLTYRFTSPPNLNSLSLQLKNPLIANKSLINLTLGDNFGNEISSITFSGDNVGDPGWIDFSFPPQSGGDYLLTLTTDSTLAESLFLIAHTPTSWNSKMTTRNASFSSRIHYQLNSFWETLSKMDHGTLFIYFLFLLIPNILILRNEK